MRKVFWGPLRKVPSKKPLEDTLKASHTPGENFIFHFELSYIVWNFVIYAYAYLRYFLYIACQNIYKYLL